MGPKYCLIYDSRHAFRAPPPNDCCAGLRLRLSESRQCGHLSNCFFGTARVCFLLGGPPFWLGFKGQQQGGKKTPFAKKQKKEEKKHPPERSTLRILAGNELSWLTSASWLMSSPGFTPNTSPPLKASGPSLAAAWQASDPHSGPKSPAIPMSPARTLERSG